MADSKVTDLPIATIPLDGTEVVYLVQGGLDTQSTVRDITDAVPPTVWGSITGNLVDQADLLAALDDAAASAAIGGTISGGTDGSVLFVGSGTLAQDNANLFFDDTNNRFGVGTASPLARQHIVVNAIGASPALANGLLLDNQTAAAAGAQQEAPSIYQRSRGWKTNTTAASQTVDSRVRLIPIQGTGAPTGSMTWGFSINGAGFNTAMSLGDTGNLSVTTSIICNGTFYNASGATGANLWVNSASTGQSTNAAGITFGASGNIGFRTAFNGTTNYGMSANNNYGAVIVGAMAATEASSGTHPVLANMIIRPPVFTNGAGASTDICTFYIEGAPTGTATSTNGNLALLINGGNSRTNGMFSIGGGGGVVYSSWLTLGASTETLGVVTFTSGSFLTSPSRHTMDYDGTLWGLTNNDNVHRKMATWITNGTPTLAGVAPAPVDYYGASKFRILGEPDGWFETLHPDTGAPVGVPYYNL